MQAQYTKQCPFEAVIIQCQNIGHAGDCVHLFCNAGSPYFPNRISECSHEVLFDIARAVVASPSVSNVNRCQAQGQSLLLWRLSVWGYQISWIQH